MRVLIVRPPKYLWPYINEQDNFLLPQAMVCLGAELRRRGHQVTLLDCLPEKVGWKTLGERIRHLRPQVVACGDAETLFAHESGRVLSLAKSVDPGIFTVSGGPHFTHDCKHAFENWPIDAIVRGEGEITFGELVDTLDAGDPWRNLPGLAYPGEEGRVIYTKPRELISDMDALPFPAYDMVPMARYGKARYLFSPGGITMHHSRGCVDDCSFCACWLQMAKRKGEGEDERLFAHYRTRSVAPVIEEMEILKKDYGKKCVIFVDDTFNAHPRWNAEFADALLKKSLKMHWFAFMRSDMMMRDEKDGVLEKFIRSGLRHICIGIERADDQELADLHKHNQDTARIREFLPHIRKRYPELFIQSTFIIGLRQDNAETLGRLVRYVEELAPDFPAFHPITPVPGTRLWKEAREKGWLEITDYRQYDWITPIMSTEHLTREELDQHLFEMAERFMKVRWLLRGLLSPHRYKRRMYIWWFLVSMRRNWDYLLARFIPFGSSFRKLSLGEYAGMLKPAWYDT